MLPICRLTRKLILDVGSVLSPGKHQMRKFLLALSGLLIVLLAALCVGTISFTSKQIPVPAAAPIKLDRNALASRLSRAIQFQTVSLVRASKAGGNEFLRFHRFLTIAFPRVRATLTREAVGTYSLLYTWKGTDERLKPMLLMGHMDVVRVDPETEKNWTHPPFSGRIADGFIWGRGAMDDKVSILGLLEAVEHLLTDGFKPQRTIYLAFGHDEEIGGTKGAAKIAELLKARKVELESVLDEGGNLIEGMIPGIAAPIALVGIAEKGYVSLELAVESPGGHASTPPTHTAIGILSTAIHKLERNPFPTALPSPTQKFLEFAGPEMQWPRRLVLANPWLFQWLIEKELARSPASGAMVRTTQAVTIFESGMRENILPVRAKAVVNIRILPGDNIAGVIEHVRRAIDDPRVAITLGELQVEPSAMSDVESPSFKRIQISTRQTMPEAIIAPALLVAATDSRHYAGLTRNIFRFIPFTLRPEDVRRFHGIDERISVQDHERCVRFFINLIRNSTHGN